MVVMLGCGRMAAMVRLLNVGSFQQTTTEEATDEKIAAQMIHNEFHDVDEANLLEEKDMHVFDCRPLIDPLHLVCCNTCKKPIKASQYSAHAEHCGPVNSMKNVLELDGGVSHKKPPRKGRKLIQSANGNLQMTVVEQGKPVLMNGNPVGGSPSNFALDNHFIEVDASEIAPGGGEFQKKQLTRREVPGNGSIKNQSSTKSLKHVLVHNQHHQREAPAPLASKIYYSRGDHRLRLELQHLFHEACAKEHSRDSLGLEPAQENGTIPSQFLSSSKLPYGTVRNDVPQIKVQEQHS